MSAASTSSHATSGSSLVVYGSTASCYTGKLEAYFRAKGVAYPLVPFAESNMRRAARHTGVVQIPQVECPDGSWLVDTTLIREHYERLQPEPAVTPANPAVAFVSLPLRGAQRWSRRRRVDVMPIRRRLTDRRKAPCKYLNAVRPPRGEHLLEPELHERGSGVPVQRVLPYDDCRRGKRPLLGIDVDREVGIRVVERSHLDAIEPEYGAGGSEIGARTVEVRMRLNGDDHPPKGRLPFGVSTPRAGSGPAAAGTRGGFVVSSVGCMTIDAAR